MNNNDSSFMYLRILGSVLLLIATLKMPYGYYTLMKLFVFGVSVYGTYKFKSTEKIFWAWTFGAITLLFNPLIPIRLDRDTWFYVDIVIAFFYLISIFINQNIINAGQNNKTLLKNSKICSDTIPTTITQQSYIVTIPITIFKRARSELIYLLKHTAKRHEIILKELELEQNKRFILERSAADKIINEKGSKLAFVSYGMSEREHQLRRILYKLEKKQNELSQELELLEATKKKHITSQVI